MQITGCHWNRPDYTRRSLEALAACRGIADCELRIACEPGCPEVEALLRSFSACPIQVRVNPVRLGCNVNTVQAIDWGFAADDFVIHVEDDVLLAADALEYFTWARDQYRDAAHILAITAYNRAPARGRDHAVCSRRWFCPWGWATWRSRWDQARAAVDAADRATWDTLIQRQFITPRGSSWREVYPELSRSQNVGERSSLHSPRWFTPEWHAANQHAPHWADPAVAPGAFWDAGETAVAGFEEAASS